LGIVLIFTVFMLIEQNDLRNRLLRLAGVERLNMMTQALMMLPAASAGIC